MQQTLISYASLQGRDLRFPYNDHYFFLKSISCNTKQRMRKAFDHIVDNNNEKKHLKLQTAKITFFIYITHWRTQGEGSEKLP